MNKNFLYIGIVVAAAAILGGGAYFYLNSRPVQPAITSNTSNNQTPSNPSTMQSLRDLLTSKQSVKCTFSDTSSFGNMMGTTYIASGKVRADSTIKSGNQTIGSHMIVDGNTGYLWMDGQTQGFKMSLDTTTQSQTGNQQTQTFDADKKMNYNCGPWAADASMFALPAGIQFSSLGTTGATSAPTFGDSGDKCSTCDNLPEPGKAQCRAALYCN